MQMSLVSFTLIRAPRGQAVGTELHQHQPLIPQRYLSSSRRTPGGKLTWVQWLWHYTEEILKAVIMGKCSSMLFKARY